MVASLIRRGAQHQLEAMLAEAGGSAGMDGKFSFQRQDVSARPRLMQTCWTCTAMMVMTMMTRNACTDAAGR